MKTKSPLDSSFITRKIVAPDSLNTNGTLFGGVLMSWIDEVAFMTARRYAGRPFVVTASIDNITFLQPLRMGEHVILTSQVNYTGRTSMEIGVKIEKEDWNTGERIQASSAYLTFVALDENGKPVRVPELLPDTPEDQRRYEEALLRVKIRERIRGYHKRKAALRGTGAGQTERKQQLHTQMLEGLKDLFGRYQRISKVAHWPIKPKDLRGIFRGKTP